MFNNLKRKNIIYRNNKLLSKIWNNFKKENEENKNENEVLRQFINHDIINLTFGDLIESNLINILYEKDVIMDIGCGIMTLFYDILYKFKIENKMDSPLLIGIDILDFKPILKNIDKNILINYEKKDYTINEFLLDNYVLDKYDINLFDLKYKKNSVDFVFQRDMISAYNCIQWDSILNKIYNVLKIKGTVEFIEYDINIKNIGENNEISYIINESLIDIFKNNNIEINISNICEKIKNKFGTENIEIIKKKLPLYIEDEFNGLVLENMKIGYQYFKIPFMKILKIKKYNNYDDFNYILNNVINEWETNRSYLNLYYIKAIKV